MSKLLTSECVGDKGEQLALLLTVRWLSDGDGW